MPHQDRRAFVLAVLYLVSSCLAAVSDSPEFFMKKTLRRNVSGERGMEGELGAVVGRETMLRI